MSFAQSNGLVAAAFLLSIGTATGVFAQQPAQTAGMVRISDGGVRSGGQASDGQNVTQASSRFGHGGSGAPFSDGSCQGNTGAYGSGSCPSGRCQQGNCPQGGGGRCRGGHGSLHGVFSDHYCKHSPDYGYSPPSKYPLHRRGVEYDRYYPAQWYGAGADYTQSTAPMVYQPTDTTQMGFYYQHTPFWQPQPDRLPERPIPAQWHITPPAVQASRYCNGQWGGYAYGGYYGHQGMGHGAGWTRSGNCPPSSSMNGGSGVLSNGSNVAPGTPTDQGMPVKPTPLEAAPVPVDRAPEPLPTDSDSDYSGTAPNTLPPTPSATLAPSPLPTLQRTPVPTNSAASGHIRRSVFRTNR